MKVPVPPPGYVDRGMVMPAYPTPEQVAKIEAMQPSLRACWNWLVSRIEEPLKAREAKAVREGLIEPPIPRPCYEGLQPEEAKALKQKYAEKCKDRSKRLFDLDLPIQWRPNLDGPNSEAERLGFTQDYHVLNNYLEFRDLPKLSSMLLTTLVKNFNKKVTGQLRKKSKRPKDRMPIQSNTGQKLRLRQNTSHASWHIRRCNAEVFLPSVGWIAVYLNPGLVSLLMTPGNTVRHGCALKEENGRWFASVKVIRREVMHPGPCDGSSVGIDPGLAKLATTSDGDVLSNPRNLKYAEARELALAVVDCHPDKEQRKQFREAVFRHDNRQRRRVLTQCRQFAAFLSRRYDFIGIEANNGVALGVGSRYLGATKTLYGCLVARCGLNRVREIEPYFNSQTCAKCNHIDKETWSRKLGEKLQICKCIACGYEVDRDLNSAQNVHTRLKESLGLN